jgi:hypothetical protein
VEVDAALLDAACLVTYIVQLHANYGNKKPAVKTGPFPAGD